MLFCSGLDFLSSLFETCMTKPNKVKEAKKTNEASKPKINKNQSLRDEQAMIATKFKENISIEETSGGIQFYKCRLCKEFFTSVHLCFKWYI